MQQVNLYLEEFRPKKNYFSAEFTGVSVALLLVFLIGIQWLVSHSIKKVESSVIALENQKVATELQVEKLKSTPIGGSAPQLDEEIAILKEEKSSREKLREIIEYQNLGNAEGFTAIMAALARQSIDVIALERIRVTGAGNMVELAGKTRTPKAVPVYLQALQSEQVLANAQFGLLRIEQPESQSQNIMAFAFGFSQVAGANK